MKGGSKYFACLILFFILKHAKPSVRNRTRYIRKDICFDLFLFFCMSDQNRHSCIVHLRLIQSGFSHVFVVYSVEIRVMNIQSALLQGVETSCMCVCTKRVCVSITEPKACTVAQLRRVHLFIVNCLLKNKFNIHCNILFISLSQHYKPNFHAKNIIWLKFTMNYSLFKLNYNWRHCNAISLT